MLDQAIRDEEQRVVEAIVTGDMAKMTRARERLERLEADARKLTAARDGVKMVVGGGR